MLTDDIQAVPYLDQFFALDTKAQLFQFHCERPAINAFNKAGAKLEVDYSRGVDNYMCKFFGRRHAVTLPCILNALADSHDCGPNRFVHARSGWATIAEIKMEVSYA